MVAARLVPPLAVLALALPGTALAQSAVDDQYVDPLPPPSEQPAGPSGGGGGSSGGGGGGGSAEAAAASPSGTAPQADGTPGTGTGTNAGAAPGSQLARTGTEAWIPALAGFLLLASGLALRARLLRDG